MSRARVYLITVLLMLALFNYYIEMVVKLPQLGRLMAVNYTSETMGRLMGGELIFAAMYILVCLSLGHIISAGLSRIGSFITNGLPRRKSTTGGTCKGDTVSYSFSETRE